MRQATIREIWMRAAAGCRERLFRPSHRGKTLTARMSIPGSPMTRIEDEPAALNVELASVGEYLPSAIEARQWPS